LFLQLRTCFFVYLTRLFLHAWVVYNKTENINELGLLRKEIVVACSKALPEQLFGGLDKKLYKSVRIVGLHTKKCGLTITSLQKVPPSNILTPALTILATHSFKLHKGK
jgi:hypothetical protein